MKEGLSAGSRRSVDMKRSFHRRFALALLLVMAMPPFCSWSTSLAEPHRFATVPALAVGFIGGKEIGAVHYIAIQLDRDPDRRGPTILFSEIALGGGSAVGKDWKQGVRTAVAAAAGALGEDQRNWTVTIKNRSYSSLTEGASASSAVAVGIMAAWRGATIRSDVALTGVITADGRIREVGNLRGKLEGAALAKMHTLLVPKGEARTLEWDLYELGRQYNMTVIEVGSLREAYELMTGQQP